MVTFRPKPSPLIPEQEVDFEALCKAAFNYRRKTLENSLSRHPVFGKVASLLLKSAAIDGSRRAEQLSVQEYEDLTRAFFKLKTANGPE